ncbi:Mgr1p SCDLUD_003834 [Saccharomycodes ludwigii]|uniref:Mgr1p n=1 Tax=Saccharomycodes ludwigii TaxID=36035 RepID=UPI001E8C2BA6|nr:hypothetical protein SCDLUD_003834 [Saccharomycodes ludwigii]KAH3899556.1 hypothetical protein SCDLUD_003834 [Saccharomycodes ludwigii]
MGLYSPPDKSSSPPSSTDDNIKNAKSPNDADDTETIHFYNRPSIGLRMWGPLVPGSDCRWGLWTLLTIQTFIGYKFLRKFIKITFPYMTSNTTVKRNIADIPSLNRFGGKVGDPIYVLQPTSPNAVNPINTTTTTNNISSATISNLSRFGAGTRNINRTTINNSRNNNDKHWFTFTFKKNKNQNNENNSNTDSKYTNFTRVFYFVSGCGLLGQSLLEFLRLTFFDYDPWYEQAKAVREKAFFNDIQKYYREGIDPTKISVKVKDSKTGKLKDVTSDSGVLSSVAIARATMKQSSFLNKWYGPMDYKPLSFEEYLDRIEHFQEYNDSLHKLRGVNELITASITGDHKSHGSNLSKELEKLHNVNLKARNSTLKLLNNVPANTLGTLQNGDENSTTDSSSFLTFFQINDTVKIIPSMAKNYTNIELSNTWTLNDPWEKLAIETELGIKIIPNSRNFNDYNDLAEEKDSSSPATTNIGNNGQTSSPDKTSLLEEVDKQKSSHNSHQEE